MEQTLVVAVDQLESYLAEFTEFAKQAAVDTPPWLRDLRDRAFSRFCEVGFPTTRDEDWRFTNLSSIVRTQFKLADGGAIPSKSDLTSWQFENCAARLVFLNGQFAPELSTRNEMPESIIATGLRDAIAHHPGAVARHLGRYLNIERDPFCALNTAFTADGAYIHVPAKAVVQRPIHLLFVSTSGDAPVMTHPRNLIVVEKEAQVSVVEDYVSFGPEIPTLSNAVTELVAEENSSVAHTLIEREHQQTYNISTLRIEQGRSANVASHSLLLGGALVRNNVHPVLAGEGGECLINGLFVGNGRQHLDNYMLVEHASPHCASRQFYNGILDGHSHGVFHGRIIVHKDAQKTDAKQTNRNLLLTDDAQIDTKPQLEIYADDVKCTHGATIGQIEENALFYLRSRGIPEIEARQLLLEAFAGECLDRMQPGSARDHAQALIEQYLSKIALTAPARETGHNSPERNWKEVE
ncbi:MAG TPA: Fe-S cluster assembly protein SufD [Terracidiphilus sp.]|jgi:Fe-S cluster assembly protein SufD